MTVNSAVNGAPGGAAASQARELLEQERRTHIAELELLAGESAPDEAVMARRGTLEGNLEEIDAALARLGDGTYGLCEDCRKPIPEGRLEIIPYARRCVNCQQRRR
ncbi:TraR/DksA family transcriptional regulator [Actinomadura bangladeshensis]|uniref:Molecular chaperone DnaK n=2 Tax=Actinomadura bangladeshensis TaxID=453573 RepID=A0A4R4N2Z5_9ACTN|nr:TraR/DksA C4-type zinc finger protein [Actinomadura bangladeshensis]TDC03089.1 molecular chaperone DnaK [Actinomadura bangladeshensis]